MKTSSNRITFLDFMRGFAVIFMVMGHSIDSVLSLDVRTTEAFRFYDAVRGFTAPMFLFVSGYAYIVATEKRWEEFRSFGTRTAKRLMKVGFLFLIGYALHFPFFSFEKLISTTNQWQLAQFYQADVLHCVAACLLILQLLLFVIRTQRAFALTILGLDLFIVYASPFVWNIDFAPIVSPVLSPYFNQTQPSIFPMFPFAGFLLSGVVAGHFYLEAREKVREQAFMKNVMILAFAAIAAGILLDLVPVRVYPDHDYWKSSPDWFLVRVGIVSLVSVAFYHIRRLPQPFERHLVMLGQASLMIYSVHLVLVYGSAANNGLMQIIGQNLAAHQAILIGLGVLTVMLLLTYAWNYLHENNHVYARLIQAGIASTLLYTFLTRPW